MAEVFENPVADEVAKVAEGFGYEAEIVYNTPESRLLEFFRGRKFRPDVIVRHNNRSVVVVARSRPAMMYDVFLTSRLRDKRGENDTRALFCVKDKFFSDIRGSSREYAGELNVRLCPLSEVGDVLQDLLE